MLFALISRAFWLARHGQCLDAEDAGGGSGAVGGVDAQVQLIARRTGLGPMALLKILIREASVPAQPALQRRGTVLDCSTGFHGN
jgi:hypothetical protein